MRYRFSRLEGRRDRFCVGGGPYSLMCWTRLRVKGSSITNYAGNTGTRQDCPRRTRRMYVPPTYGSHSPLPTLAQDQVKVRVSRNHSCAWELRGELLLLLSQQEAPREPQGGVGVATKQAVQRGGQA